MSTCSYLHLNAKFKHFSAEPPQQLESWNIQTSFNLNTELYQPHYYRKSAVDRWESLILSFVTDDMDTFLDPCQNKQNCRLQSQKNVASEVNRC